MARSALIAIAVVLAAGVTVAFPSFWALPALAIPLGMVVTSGRWRWFVGVVGIPLVVLSFGRFALVYARPHFDAGDIEEGEKNALSRIREIYWAESQAHRNKLSATGRYLTFPELLGGSPALLKPALYTPVDAGRGVYQSEGYLYVIYLPGKDGLPTVQADSVDPVAAGRSFAAYAWPTDSKRGGHRVFYADQFEQLCESANQSGFYGPRKVPAPTAYALNASAGISSCGRDEPSDEWHPWAQHHRSTPWSDETVRVKQPRADR